MGPSHVQEGVGEGPSQSPGVQVSRGTGGKAGLSLEEAAHPSCSGSTHTSFRSKV